MILVDHMGKRKKGRGRGRHGGGPGTGGPGTGGSGGRVHGGGDRGYGDRGYGGGRTRHRRNDTDVGPGNNFPDQEPVTENGEPIPLIEGGGVLELHPNGYGFFRDPKTNYHPRTHRSVRARHDDRKVPPPRRSADQRHGPAEPPAARPAAQGNHRRRRPQARGLSHWSKASTS